METPKNTDARPKADIQQVTPANAEPVATVAPFNPFTVLPVGHITALVGSYNKQWRQAHAVDVSLAMTEFSCSENEAIFYAALKSDAENILDREAVTEAVDLITAQLRGVAFPKSSDVSLGLIKGYYDDLKTELRKTVGTRVRDWANKEYVQETAKGVLDKVYAYLGVKETDWMR